MELVIRATVIYFMMLLLVRVMGRRELSEMSAFELLVLVTMGDLVQQGVTQEDMSITGAVVSIGTMGFWSVLIAYVTYKLPKAEKLFSGIPIVVIDKGKLVEEALHLERVPHADVFEAARRQGIDDLDEVRVGILEPDGKFAFIRYDSESPPADDEESKAR